MSINTRFYNWNLATPGIRLMEAVKRAWALKSLYLVSRKEETFGSTGTLPFLKTTTYGYNHRGQVITESCDNSRGDLDKIEYRYSSRECRGCVTGVLKYKGDSITSVRAMYYNQRLLPDPNTTWKLLLEKPVSYRQFAQMVGLSPTLAYDTIYNLFSPPVDTSVWQLERTISRMKLGQPTTIFTSGDRITGIQYGYRDRYPIASARNARHEEFSFTNFEPGSYNSNISFDPQLGASPIEAQWTCAGADSTRLVKETPHSGRFAYYPPPYCGPLGIVYRAPTASPHPLAERPNVTMNPCGAGASPPPAPPPSGTAQPVDDNQPQVNIPLENDFWRYALTTLVRMPERYDPNGSSLDTATFELSFWARARAPDPSHPQATPGTCFAALWRGCDNPSSPLPPLLIPVTSDKWRLYKVLVTAVSYNYNPIKIRLAGQNLLFDDVGIYPLNVRLTTYTHKVGVGVGSVIDENGKLTSFEYDKLGRLIRERDQDGNITKEYQYEYARP